jgi:GH15 family glucan-1,4-alpha-glucosidase
MLDRDTLDGSLLMLPETGLLCSDDPRFHAILTRWARG